MNCHRSLARRVPAVGFAALVLLLGSCSNSDGGDTASERNADITTTTAEFAVRDSVYAVPDPLPKADPGTVIASGEQPPAERLPDASFTRFVYHSQLQTGADTAVSGALFVPDGDAPDGGWPVISWGHGTTGVADMCAPSLTDNLFYNEYSQEVASFLKAGYAVVASDYPGLGTPGMHGYLVGEAEGNAMVDAVTAARNLDGSLGSTWFAVGHSQGGQAALFATRSAERAPDLTLAGAVAMAPASGLEVALPFIVSGGVPADLVYGVYALAGQTTVDPSLDLESLLGPEGRDRLDLITKDGCLIDTLAELGPIAVEDIFDLTPERAQELSNVLASYGNPENEPTIGPALVVQGETDKDVPVGLTDQMVRRLQDLGSDVEYRRYPNLNHDEVLGPSICDVLAWLADHGGPATPNCVPYDTDLS